MVVTGVRSNEPCSMPTSSHLVEKSAVFHPVLWEAACALEDFLRRLMEEKGVTENSITISQKCVLTIAKKKHCCGPICTEPLAAL